MNKTTATFFSGKTNHTIFFFTAKKKKYYRIFFFFFFFLSTHKDTFQGLKSTLKLIIIAKQNCTTIHLSNPLKHQHTFIHSAQTHSHTHTRSTLLNLNKQVHIHHRSYTIHHTCFPLNWTPTHLHTYTHTHWPTTSLPLSRRGTQHTSASKQCQDQDVPQRRPKMRTQASHKTSFLVLGVSRWS